MYNQDLKIISDSLNDNQYIIGIEKTPKKNSKEQDKLVYLVIQLDYHNQL